LPNNQWQSIKDLLPGQKGDPDQTDRDNRLLIETVRWIAPTGSPWRHLLPTFGNWHRVYRRCSGWGQKGVWKPLLVLEQVSDDIDRQQLLLHSIIIPVDQPGAGATKEGPPAIGRSPGGLTTKIDSAVDGLGNPLGSILTAGQDSDIIQAAALI
jgi:transposase